jgi:hypothetical protein
MNVPPQYERPSSPGIHPGFEDTVHILHIVRPEHDFTQATQNVFALIRDAQKQYPNQPRVLYVEIEGHTGTSSGFDPDFFEFQQEFLQGFLGPFLSAVATPLQSLYNPNPQRNDLPDLIEIGA